MTGGSYAGLLRELEADTKMKLALKRALAGKCCSERRRIIREFSARAQARKEHDEIRRMR